MITDQFDSITNAVLYEGYILYPYRPCVKNQRRWMFGSIVPHAVGLSNGERWAMQTQILVEGDAATQIEIEVRFLHLLNRRVGRSAVTVDDHAEPSNFEFFDSCDIDGARYQTWQEAIERRVAVAPCLLSNLLNENSETSFAYPRSYEIEALPSTATGYFAYVREQSAIQGVVTVSTSKLTPGLFCLTACIENTSVASDPSTADSTANELLGLASTHTILAVDGGEFISAIDPPAAYRQESANLKNDGTWPVLVGNEGERHMVLSSPIILYDYPQVAPESVGDWFDATEIDEMLDLRTRTLTDVEKTVMRSVDEHARRLLERTERTETTDLASLHGTLRGLRRIDMANL